VPRREGNRVQLAARQLTAGRACSKEELGREGKDPVKPPDCGEGGKQATVTVSILHASLKAACGRSGQSRCFVVAVQPTSAGHALGQAIACTCLPCQHGNYLALQPVTGRASEQQPATSNQQPATTDQRLPTGDQRPANQARSASATTAVHFVCTSRLRHLLEARLGIWFPDNQARHPSACACIYLYLYLYLFCICVCVCVRTCFCLLQICREVSIQFTVTYIRSHVPLPQTVQPSPSAGAGTVFSSRTCTTWYPDLIVLPSCAS
jgi:hypothetical protein